MAKQVRRFMTFLFAAIHVVTNIFYSAAYAAGDVTSSTQKVKNALPGDNSVKADTAPKPSPVGQPTSDYKPPAARSMKSVDSIVVPSPRVEPTTRKAYEAIEAKATGDVSSVLDKFHLTPAQRISVRNYIGQYDEKTKITSAGNVNGVEVLSIKDAKTGDFIGRVDLKPAPDGGIVVNKSTAAEFDYKKTVEIPIAGKVDPEEARKVLSGSEAYRSFENKDKEPSLTASLPAINAEAGVDYGKARESTAHFNPDGSGYEYGLLTKIASGNAEGKAGVSTERTEKGGSGYLGVEAGAGAKGTVVEGFVNYFGKPDVDEKGHFTRSVLGGSYEMHSTLAEVEAKLGCDTEKGCGTELSAGALGIGAGGSVTFSSHIDIPVKSVEEIPDQGMAAPVTETQEPELTGEAAAEAVAADQAYEKAMDDGSPEALKNYLQEYPNSDNTDEVLNKLDLGSAGEPEGLCDSGSTQSPECGRAGY